MYSMSCRLKRIMLEVRMLPSYSKSHFPSNVRFQSIYVLKILKNIQCYLIIHKIFLWYLLISNSLHQLYVSYHVCRRKPLLSSLNYNLHCLKDDKFWRRIEPVVEYSINDVIFIFQVRMIGWKWYIHVKYDKYRHLTSKEHFVSVCYPFI